MPNNKILKSLRNSDNYSLKTFVLGRKEYSGARKLWDEIDLKLVVLLPDDYHYSEFDCIVCGVNPVINVIVGAFLEMKGKSALVSTQRMQDSWDYNQLKSIAFQKVIASKFRMSFSFLTIRDENKRVLVFLDNFFETMSKTFTKTVFVSKSDIAITSDARKFDGKYLLKSQLGTFIDKLPFNLPEIDGEPLYNKAFNLFYKIYSQRENDWIYATDVEKQNPNYRLKTNLDEHAFYHLFAPSVLITSHYHPYIKDKELEDKSVFKIIGSTNLNDLEKWIEEM